MATQTTITGSKPSFTATERRSLRALRNRYREDHDLFTNRERVQLAFLRWLVENELIES
jgi:hypothetical protein